MSNNSNQQWLVILSRTLIFNCSRSVCETCRVCDNIQDRYPDFIDKERIIDKFRNTAKKVFGLKYGR